MNRRHVMFVDDEQRILQNQAQWANRLNLALRDDRFQLYFQPIQAIESSNDGEHLEILIRMLDASGRIIGPSSFLVAAEHYCISPQLDRWVIKNTIGWFAKNPHKLNSLSMCSINLSGRSIGDKELLGYIMQIFDKYPDIKRQKICFEITETAAIMQLSDAIDFFKALNKKRFRIALDDFGSGFSSFAYLKNLPVDILKIDGMSVKQIHTNPVDREMVRSINEIGKLMGKKTIAEFVENREILDTLRSLKVDYAQRHHFGCARPLDEMV